MRFHDILSLQDDYRKEQPDMKITRTLSAVLLFLFLLPATASCAPQQGMQTADSSSSAAAAASSLLPQTDLDQAEPGKTYTIRGKVVSISRYRSGSALLSVDQGTEEAAVYISADSGVDLMAISVDENYIITGILSEYKGGRELLLSSAQNISAVGGCHFEKVEVVSVIDGDTIKVRHDSGEISKVRVIGADCPETEKEGRAGEFYAAEASVFASDTLLGKDIYLERDNSETDKYDRLLRYVWLSIPSEINEENLRECNFSAMLIEGGYAEFIEIGNDNKYADFFRALEEAAVSGETGMWQKES